MSYVGDPFLHDLFVTYSHGRGAGANSGFLQSWSELFAKELNEELQLNRALRDDLRVFLDKDLRPAHGVDPLTPLSGQLREQVGAAAVLVILMSPDYLSSEWCARERSWWHERQHELDVPVMGRTAVVHILPTEETWPQSLIDAEGNRLLGFMFHETVNGVVRPLGWLDRPGPFGSEARRALLDIVGRLSSTLDNIRDRLEERRRARAEAEKLAHEKVTLYLHSRSDQSRVWAWAVNALQGMGFGVVPGDPEIVERDPTKREIARQARVSLLSECDAMLLVGTSDGRALDEDLVAVGRTDRQSARARSNRLLPCGVLDTVGGLIANSVRKETARILQADWIDATRDPWTPEVRAWLMARSAQVRAPS